MDDDRGGWKAADTALWREHIHAATMVGRVAAARQAVALGYGIVADDGPSGRLRSWAVAGIPDEVLEVHSKRAAEITAETQRRGFDSLNRPGFDGGSFGWFLPGRMVRPRTSQVHGATRFDCVALRAA
jgi:hypothetical protein